MVHVTQQLLLLLLVLKLLAGVAHDEAREEGARVCGGVDQAVDDVVTRGGDRCHLTVELENQSTAAFCLLRAVLFVSAWDIPDRCTTHWDLAVA